MATNRELRAALLKKRNISKQRLSQLVQELKGRLPMDTPQAIHTIAHKSGLDISKYLAPEEIAEVRGFVAQLGATTPAAASSNGKTTRRRAAPKPALVTVGGFGVKQLPGMSAIHAQEAQKMANVYAAMYVFENSLRDIIERVLEKHFATDWWTKAVHHKIRDVAADRKAQEKNDPGHGKRGNRPIDYVDLLALEKIIKHHWKLFEKIFPSQAWIEVLVSHDMNVSRRPIAHMNPLAADDIKNVENALRKYEKVLKANAAEIP